MKSGRGTKLALLGAGALLSASVLGGCGTFRAERQGKQLGNAICDLKTADKGEVQKAADKVQREMDDVSRIVGRPVQQDVSDINNNLSDLRTHVVNGNSLLVRQDVNAIKRNTAAVGRTLNGKAKAAYDGIQEGLGACDYP